MLHVSRLGSGRAGYYLSDLALEVPAFAGEAAFLGDADPSAARDRPNGGLAGVWVGRGSDGLGLTGAVDPARFNALLDDQAPTGHPLTGSVTSVAGYDLTFTCPKAASVLFAIGAPDVARTVVAAHQSAVGAATAYLEDRAIAVRRGSGDDRHLLPTGGAVGAAFTHGTSRSLDPHLHTHVVVANMARGADGRWSAIDGRSLYAHARAAGSLHDAHLRQALARTLSVDFTWATDGRGAGLAGLPSPVVAQFSTRRAEIDEHRWRHHAHSPKAARTAWAVTRDAKPADLDPDGLRRQWVGRAASAGLDAAAIDRITGQAVARGASDETIDEHRFAAALWVSPHATAARRDVIEAWAGAARDGVSVRDVLGAVDAWVPPRHGLGVEEPRHPLSSVVPSGAALQVLGPRPATAELQPVWRSGAAMIEDYRRRWQISDRGSALGVDGSPSSLASLPARRLADHLDVVRSLERVARTLGREPAVHTRDRGFDLGR